MASADLDLGGPVDYLSNGYLAAPAPALVRALTKGVGVSDERQNAGGGWLPGLQNDLEVEVGWHRTRRPQDRMK